MKHIFFSILTGLAFWHCQTPAPAPKNILNCYVRYDAAEGLVKAEAYLKEGTSKKTIEMPGGLRFQSTAMKLLPVRGITYSTEFPAAYMPEQVFDWTLDQNRLEVYKQAIPSIDSFFFNTKVLSTKKSSNLLWVGKPLSKGETLVFMWENEKDGQTTPMEVSTTLGEPLIEVPAAKLEQLGAGTWTLYLVRKRLSRAELSSLMVESVSEYYTKAIKVKIE